MNKLQNHVIQETLGFDKTQPLIIGGCEYRVAGLDDLDQIEKLENQWPGEIQTDRDTLIKRLEMGVDIVLAVDKTTNAVVSTLMAQRVLIPGIRKNTKLAIQSWDKMTNEGTLSEHTQNGNVLDAVSLIVDKNHRGQGIATRTLHCGISLAAKSPEVEFVTSNIRAPGFKAWRAFNPGGSLRTAFEDYVYRCDDDPVINFHLSVGGRIQAPWEGQRDDSSSLGMAIGCTPSKKNVVTVSPEIFFSIMSKPSVSTNLVCLFSF